MKIRSTELVDFGLNYKRLMIKLHTANAIDVLTLRRMCIVVVVIVVEHDVDAKRKMEKGNHIKYHVIFERRNALTAI